MPLRSFRSTEKPLQDPRTSSRVWNLLRKLGPRGPRVHYLGLGKSPPRLLCALTYSQALRLLGRWCLVLINGVLIASRDNCSFFRTSSAQPPPAKAEKRIDLGAEGRQDHPSPRCTQHSQRLLLRGRAGPGTLQPCKPRGASSASPPPQPLAESTLPCLYLEEQRWCLPWPRTFR